LIIAGLAGAGDDGLLEVNASDNNGVDAARELSEISASRPFNGKRRVIVLNEAHQLTSSAQNALKDPMEKNSAIWILTTDRPDKIEPAIKSRASAATFELKPLTTREISLLLKSLVPEDDLRARLTTFLTEKGVRSPREILGVLDQHLAGVPLEECVHGSEHEPLYRDVASAVLQGNWAKTAGLLKQIKTADYRGMISMVSAFLANALLDSDVGPRADALSTCLVGLGNSNFADGIAYAATKALLYKCAKALSGGNK
jgi:DNA polymerase III gamma/tau subunit